MLTASPMYLNSFYLYSLSIHIPRDRGNESSLKIMEAVDPDGEETAGK